VTTVSDPAPRVRPRRPCRAGGDLGAALPWGLVRAAVLLTVLGTLGYDVCSVALISFRAQEAADGSAIAAADSWKLAGNVDTAYRAALERVGDHGLGISPDHFSITTDGTIALRVHGTAHTLVLGRIGSLRSWTEITADASVQSSQRLG
jgi:hypothetical protein